MVELEKEIKKEEKAVEKFFKKFGFNLWMVISAVLVVVIILMLVWPKGDLSANTAGEKLTAFLNANYVPDGGVAFKSAVAQGTLYLVNLTYQGKDVQAYITKDGKYFLTANPVEIDTVKKDSSAATQQQPSAEVPKTASPKVEAFVFSYCPYGLQFEKALSPVYSLLKNKADINIVYIGAMHGEFEKTESLRQLCIQKNYGKDKLFAYLDKFDTNTTIGGCSGDAACLSPLLTGVMKSLSIDSTKIDSCMTSDAEALYSADMARASSLGVSGSPTFVINGVETSVGRTADAIKQAICGAFTTAPSECSQTLSSTSATAGFGGGSGASTGASCG